jgi:hypothetical protein
MTEKTASAPETPVRVDERYRRLQADALSPLSSVILGLIDRLNRERIKGAGHRLYTAHRDTQITGCGPNIGMAEQHLDGAQISALIQQVRREAMSPMPHAA